MAGLDSALLLINPSRNPGQLRLLRRAARRFQVRSVVETRGRRHFVEEVERFARGPMRHLLVWGGDGTAHEAINALMRVGANKSVGFLRGGTGNGIQDSYMVPYRISRQMAVYSAAARHGYELPVDLLAVQSGRSHAWCQLVGFGLDAAVLERRERQEQLGPRVRFPVAGFLNYLTAGVGAVFSGAFRPRELTVRLARGKSAFRGPRVNAEFPFEKITLRRSPTLVEAGTRPFYGKLFRICPDVVCNDGLMDIYLFNQFSRVTIARFLPSIWTGRHGAINARTERTGRPRIERFEVAEARIESPEPFTYHVDGEIRLAEKGETEGVYTVTIAIEARALRFLVPPTFYRLFTPPQEVRPASLTDPFFP